MQEACKNTIKSDSLAQLAERRSPKPDVGVRVPDGSPRHGSMGEWSIPPASKTGNPARGSLVRIQLLPPSLPPRRSSVRKSIALRTRRSQIRILLAGPINQLSAGNTNLADKTSSKEHGKLAERSRQRIANPSSGNGRAGSIPALSATFSLPSKLNWKSRRFLFAWLQIRLLPRGPYFEIKTNGSSI